MIQTQKAVVPSSVITMPLNLQTQKEAVPISAMTTSWRRTGGWMVRLRTGPRPPVALSGTLARRRKISRNTIAELISNKQVVAWARRMSMAAQLVVHWTGRALLWVETHARYVGYYRQWSSPRQ